jgi:Alkaline phosphatase
MPAGTTKLLGLFSSSHMNVALDKIAGRRGTSTIVSDAGYPDQPMLDEMTTQALSVLSKNPAGFVLMIEGASIDKQSHNMDGDRMMLEVLEFDRAVERVRQFVIANPDTLAIVTADHESGGINIIGASNVSPDQLKSNAVANNTAAVVRDGVVANYDQAGFPYYKILSDGYPESTDVARKILLGFAANADRWENWMTRAKPEVAVSTGYFITGQVSGTAAVHTASDIPLSAMGTGSSLFGGNMDNTDVFFSAAQAAIGGVSTSTVASVTTQALNSTPTGSSGGSSNLINISSRGFVGTDDRAMFGGFVIDGTQSRTVLIRGTGPTLARFGISGVLDHPQLQLLNSSSTVMASNDTWGTSANAALIRTTASKVGAFALDEGSLDAAVLVTLSPGSYTVKLTGTAETTGIALLEVYSVQ